MRYPLLAALLFTLALQVVSAQVPGAEYAVNEHGGWKTVLPHGTLGRNAEIVPVEGGFAISAASFEDLAWDFDTEWVLYDPETGAWTDYQFPQAEPALLDLNEELLTLLEIADLVPDDPRIKYQLIDGGVKLAFLLPHTDFYDGLSLYESILIVNPATRSAKHIRTWFCQGPPSAELTVWDFPEQNMTVICNVIIRHDGNAIRTQSTHRFIGRGFPAAYQLVSHSPDHRYWIMREADFYSDHIGDFYVYDRQTGLSTVMLWNGTYKPQRDFVVWRSDAALMTNVGEYILHLDMAHRQRHELLREELSRLADDPESLVSWLSTNGEWLLVAAEDGALLLGNVLAALTEVE